MQQPFRAMCKSTARLLQQEELKVETIQSLHYVPAAKLLHRKAFTEALTLTWQLKARYVATTQTGGGQLTGGHQTTQHTLIGYQRFLVHNPRKHLRSPCINTLAAAVGSINWWLGTDWINHSAEPLPNLEVHNHRQSRFFHHSTWRHRQPRGE